MMDVCGLVGALLLVFPPIVLLWTAAVITTRVLRDLPVGPRVAVDAFATGFQLLMTWLVATSLFAGLAGAATWLPFAIWPAAADRFGIPAALSITTAVLLACILATWWLVRPIVREEWRRLTGTRSPQDHF